MQSNADKLVETLKINEVLKLHQLTVGVYHDKAGLYPYIYNLLESMCIGNIVEYTKSTDNVDIVIGNNLPESVIADLVYAKLPYVSINTIQCRYAIYDMSPGKSIELGDIDYDAIPGPLIFSAAATDAVQILIDHVLGSPWHKVDTVLVRSIHNKVEYVKKLEDIYNARI